MTHRSSILKYSSLKFVIPALAFGAISCKPRAFNDVQTTSTELKTKRRTDALAASLLLHWPIPKSAQELQKLPAATDLKISKALWGSVLSNIFTDKGTGRPLTLTNPECAQTQENWHITAARLSLYEIDLPGNVTTWQTMALQRESDLAQRVQLHITLQPWCMSSRLGRNDFVHTLDHAVQFTFDLSLLQIPQQHQIWLDEIYRKSRSKNTFSMKAENKVLPFATSLLELNSRKNGRSSIVLDWTDALKTDELLNKNSYPNATWQSAKQSLVANRQLKISTDSPLAHPSLQANPASLNSFFSKYLSEKNLLRIRAHATEGLGTAQWFYLWEQQAGKQVRVSLQTSSAQWDRTSGLVTLKPLLADAQLTHKVGTEQSISEASLVLLRDVDSDSTPMAHDIALQNLISLNEKIIDHERTSVHTTRCASCHALDEAMTFAREGRPVAQRGILPVQLTMNGVSSDAKPVINLRSLRHAEADAARFEEEFQNDRNQHSAKQ